MCGVEGLVQPLCKVGGVVGKRGLRGGILTTLVPLRSRSKGEEASHEVDFTGSIGRAGGMWHRVEGSVWGSVTPRAGLHGCVGLDQQHVRGARSAEHRVRAGGCVGARCGKVICLASGCSQQSLPVL